MDQHEGLIHQPFVELLESYNSNTDDLTFRVVTGDETWIRHWDPLNKSESKQ